MSAGTAVAGSALRRLWVTATVWAVAFGGTVAASALSYVDSFPDQASRQQLAASTSNDTGLAILLGPTAGIGTVGGYTVYKCFAFLTTIGAVWGLLAATRLLRGEEDAGRWQLVLAGDTRPARATLATLAALGAAVAIVFAGTALGAGLAGLDPDVGFGVGDSLVYGASVALAPALFVAVGALTSQLGRTRRVATGLGMAIFGVAFLVRMIADSGPGSHWLRWLTPFGWIERTSPLTDPDLRPLALGVVVIGLLVVTSLVLVGRRDAGEGVVASRDVAPPRPFGLGSPLGLTLRLELPVILAWWAGALAAALSFGIIAKIVTGRIPDSMRDTLERFGLEGTFVHQYLGIAFLMVATIVALLSTSQIGAAAEEETSGRLVHVLAQPTRRRGLLAGRLALTALAIAVAGLLSGLGAWAGARSQGVDPGLGDTVGAGLNVVPTALVVLGVGAVVLAVAPRAATRAVYGVVIASLLFDLLASMVSGLEGLERLSLFHYMALVPSQDADPVALAVSLAVAAGLCVAAVLRFDRRDVTTG